MNFAYILYGWVAIFGGGIIAWLICEHRETSKELEQLDKEFRDAVCNEIKWLRERVAELEKMK